MTMADNIPTIEFGREYVENFLTQVDRVYQDTLAYIDNNKKGTHDSGKLASIAEYIEYSRGDILARRIEIYRIVGNLVNQFGYEAVAEAMAGNVEIDYTIAIQLIPPSDIFIEYDETISQLLGITNQISSQMTKKKDE